MQGVQEEEEGGGKFEEEKYFEEESAVRHGHVSFPHIFCDFDAFVAEDLYSVHGAF